MNTLTCDPIPFAPTAELPSIPGIAALLAVSAALHHHLCPRQVLGVRMGMLAGALLHMELPQRDKRLLTVVETDGCFADGVSAATNCWVGRRTLRVEDLGKAAAIFVDTQTGEAWRVAPHPDARACAAAAAPDARDSWEAMLLGYQRLADEALLVWKPVVLVADVGALIGRPGLHVPCSRCGEEVMNGRERTVAGLPLCRTCAGSPHYVDLPGGAAIPYEAGHAHQKSCS